MYESILAALVSGAILPRKLEINFFHEVQDQLVMTLLLILLNLPLLLDFFFLLSADNIVKFIELTRDK